MGWGRPVAIAALGTLALGGAAAGQPAASNSPNTPRWLVDAQSGCYVFYTDAAPADAVSWSGACADRAAEGIGTAVFSRAGRAVLSVSGRFIRGAATGHIGANWADGSRFDGSASAGRLNGDGVLVNSGGDRFEGPWVNGKLAGKVVVTWASGDRYEGNWTNNRPNGHGVLMHQNGQRIEADFVNGEVNAPPVTAQSAPSPADMSAKQAGWLDTYAKTRLVAADGSSMVLSSSAGRIVREVVLPGGSTQRLYLALLNARQGTVSDTANPSKVAGIFRLGDGALAIDYADGRSESLTQTKSGALAFVTSVSAQATVCTMWYPEGHSFSMAERQAAVAAYAVRLGVSSAAQANCAETSNLEANLPKTDSAPADAPATRTPHHSARPKTAALSSDSIVSAQPILVRTSGVHPVDAAPAPIPDAAAKPAPISDTRVARTPSECLSVEADGGTWGFRNHCGFAVQYAYCLKEGAAQNNSCAQGATAGAVSANAFNPLFTETSLNQAEHDFRWIACAGANDEPRLVRSDPPAGQCMHMRAS